MHQQDEHATPALRRGLRADWRPYASCLGRADRHHDPWDSDDRATKPHADAADICERCPVWRECLAEAIANDEPFGTWGGLTRKQRTMLARPRNRKRCPICRERFIESGRREVEICYACGISWRKYRQDQRRSHEYVDNDNTV